MDIGPVALEQVAHEVDPDCKTTDVVEAGQCAHQLHRNAQVLADLQQRLGLLPYLGPVGLDGRNDGFTRHLLRLAPCLFLECKESRVVLEIRTPRR